MSNEKIVRRIKTITRNAIDNNLYNSNLTLAASIRASKEIQAANLLNGTLY